MLKFYSLFSGSSGNCYLIQSNSTNILVDAGESCKKIEAALLSICVSPSSIDAIFITHEHSDHIKGLNIFCKKYHIPVFANQETWNAMLSQKENIAVENQQVFSIGKEIQIQDLQINSFSIPHDAVNPCGYTISCENKKMSIATDIGHMNQSIIDSLCYSSFILIEANYDPNILKCSRYPYHLKERIAGPNGHLSNVMAGKTISYLSHFGLKDVMLGHLSRENNFPELAYQTVAEQLMENHINENLLRLSVAKRFEVSKMVEVC